MTEDEKKVEDSIHIRMVRFATKFPHGFKYETIHKKYSKRDDDWAVIDKFLYVAYTNHKNDASLVTPFLWFSDDKGNGNYDTCSYILSYEAFFNFLNYKGLVQARKNARVAEWSSAIAVAIAIVTLIVSLYPSLFNLHPSTLLDSAQFQELLQTILKK